MYKGKHERNQLCTRKRIRVIVSEALDDDEDILLSRSALERMILLPNNWPFRDDTDQSQIITSKLSKEEAEEILEGLKTGNIVRCLKATTTDKEGEKAKKERQDSWQIVCTQQQGMLKTCLTWKSCLRR